MNFRFIFLLGLFLIGKVGLMQEVILFEHMQNPNERKKFCKNCQFFAHPTLSSRFFMTLNKEKEINVRFYSSSSYTFGVRSIFKISQYIATGLDLNFDRTRFSIDQDSENDLIDTIKTTKHNIYFFSIAPSLFLRFNFDRRRGSYIGHFVDLGYRGGVNFWAQRMITGKFNSGTKYRLLYKQFENLSPYQHAFYIRFGINNLSIIMQYQQTKWLDWNKEKNFPIFSAGFEFGIFR